MGSFIRISQWQLTFLWCIYLIPEGFAELYPDHYTTLGISRMASFDNINGSYRKKREELKEQYDSAIDRKDLLEAEHLKSELDKLNEAFETLAYKDQRDKYDALKLKEAELYSIANEYLAEVQAEPGDKEAKKKKALELLTATAKNADSDKHRGALLGFHELIRDNPDLIFTVQERIQILNQTLYDLFISGDGKPMNRIRGEIARRLIEPVLNSPIKDTITREDFFKFYAFDYSANKLLLSDRLANGDLPVKVARTKRWVDRYREKFAEETGKNLVEAIAVWSKEVTKNGDDLVGKLKFFINSEYISKIPELAAALSPSEVGPAIAAGFKITEEAYKGRSGEYLIAVYAERAAIVLGEHPELMSAADRYRGIVGALRRAFDPHNCGATLRRIMNLN